MDIDWVVLVVIALATNQVVEVWRHSELCREPRYVITGTGWWPTDIFPVFGEFVASLFKCNWCLSVWIAFIIGIGWVLAVLVINGATVWCPPIFGYTFQLVITGLATSRVANLLNDVLYGYCRTPKYDAELVVPRGALAGLDLEQERAAMHREQQIIAEAEAAATPPEETSVNVNRNEKEQT